MSGGGKGPGNLTKRLEKPVFDLWCFIHECNGKYKPVDTKTETIVKKSGMVYQDTPEVIDMKLSQVGFWS